MRVYDIPEGTRQSKGRAIQNLVQIDGDDKVVAYLNVTDLKDEEYLNSHACVLCTKKGVIKKTTLEAYSRPRSNGIIAVKIRDEDELLEARLTNGTSDIIMASREGKAVHFNESGIRPMGRNSSGVRGMRLGSEADEVIGMITLNSEQTADHQVLVVSEKGYGKRSPVDEYRITKRGGKGVKTIQVTEKTGKLIAIKSVKEDDQLMIINRSGMTIRMDLSEMRVLGRATQGVRLIDLRKNDKIAAVARVESELSEDVVADLIDGEVLNADESVADTDSPAEETNGTEVAEDPDEE